jgi:hypothetical protein
MKPTGRPLLLTARSENLPLWVRARDAVLTLLLWAACAWTWLQLFPQVEAWIHASLDDGIDFDLPPIVGLAGHGLALAGGLIAAYITKGIFTWLRTDADKMLPAPAPLAPDREAELAGASQEEITAWRAQDSVIIRIGRDGRIERPARVSV